MNLLKHKKSSINQHKNLSHTAVSAAFCLLILLSATACSSKTPTKNTQAKKAATSSAVSSKVSSSVPSAVSSSSASSAVPAVTASKKTNSAKETLLNVKNIQQMPELQSGCEITAANIVLNYLGYNVSKTDLLKYLPSSDFFQTVNGKKYGPNPWKTFVGSPDTDHYGCYAPVIVNMMNEYMLNAKGMHSAVDLTGTSAQNLYTYVDAGIPVIVWVTTGMQEPSFGDSWYLNDNGAAYKWILKEHCMVLIGHNDTKAIFSDPLDKRGTVSYDKALFAQRYQALFSQAVAVG